MCLAAKRVNYLSSVHIFVKKSRRFSTDCVRTAGGINTVSAACADIERVPLSFVYGYSVDAT